MQYASNLLILIWRGSRGYVAVTAWSESTHELIFVVIFSFDEEFAKNVMLASRHMEAPRPLQLLSLWLKSAPRLPFRSASGPI